MDEVKITISIPQLVEPECPLPPEMREQLWQKVDAAIKLMEAGIMAKFVTEPLQQTLKVCDFDRWVRNGCRGPLQPQDQFVGVDWGRTPGQSVVVGRGIFRTDVC